MANLQAAVRTLAATNRSPAEVCRRVSRLIFDNTPPDKFVTFFYAVFDTSPGTLRYANAGHLPPLLVRPGEPIGRLSEGGCVLGIDKDTVYEEAEVVFAPGDRLILYTDGLTEAQDLAGEEFGDRRLRELVRRYLGCPLIRFHDALLDEVRGFAGSLQDDAAVLSIDCLAAAAC